MMNVAKEILKVVHSMINKDCCQWCGWRWWFEEGPQAHGCQGVKGRGLQSPEDSQHKWVMICVEKKERKGSLWWMRNPGWQLSKRTVGPKVIHPFKGTYGKSKLDASRVLSCVSSDLCAMSVKHQVASQTLRLSSEQWWGINQRWISGHLLSCFFRWTSI